MVSCTVKANIGIVEMQKRLVRKHVAEILRAGLEAAGKEMDRAILDGPATGRMYPSGRRGGRAAPVGAFGAARESGAMHQASAPGEAPAEDTGALRRARRDDLGGLMAREQHVRTGYGGKIAVIAASLELGTRDGKIAPRPFIRPAGTKAKEEMIAQARLIWRF